VSEVAIVRARMARSIAPPTPEYSHLRHRVMDVQPTEIKLHQASRVLEVHFANGRAFRLPYELLRVYSPSAEVRGHGPGQEVLQTGKRDVTIASVEQVGHYAIRPTFSDGHDTGIFSWDYLYDLGARQDELWKRYLDQLAAAGASRDP
jgi:DUF971 family protein